MNFLGPPNEAVQVFHRGGRSGDQSLTVILCMNFLGPPPEAVRGICCGGGSGDQWFTVMLCMNFIGQSPEAVRGLYRGGGSGDQGQLLPVERNQRQASLQPHTVQHAQQPAQ